MGHDHHAHGHADDGHSHGGHFHAGHSHGGHSHAGHGHSHAPADFGRAFQIAIGLNVAIVLLQAGYGWAAGSVALLADAGHNLSDVLGLVAAYGATVIARRPATRRFTYGLGGSTVLAALFNAVFLLVAVGALSWEAIERLRDPQPVAGGTVMIVAAIGIVLNGVSAWLFAAGGKNDVNLRGAFLHLAADAGVSVGVVLSGAAVLWLGWSWIDPLVSLLINAVIVWGTWSLLRESAGLALAGVPSGIDYGAVRAYLAGRPGVEDLHDLHIWPLSTTETALTAHLVIPAGPPGDAFLSEIAITLKVEHGIGHATLQVETGTDIACPLTAVHAIAA